MAATSCTVPGDYHAYEPGTDAGEDGHRRRGAQKLKQNVPRLTIRLSIDWFGQSALVDASKLGKTRTVLQTLNS